jgi:hypothetical protein
MFTALRQIELFLSHLDERRTHARIRTLSGYAEHSAAMRRITGLGLLSRLVDQGKVTNRSNSMSEIV